ncbi:MAG: hypothetical protein CR982_07460 [Candidatus Cloacimonadota bacterium]|nr:MAG: hypothetical protein CR982_07460 [Candidatus Cloacimonadota bacterium]PIE80169.1 MAG: hypothetical protein CSA15_02105 [Candidatus Delongbacteria bacterium]
MQVKKEKVKQFILEAARSEFLEKGFEKASLRNIAQKANATKGNIYIYFKSKDDLFSHLIKPAEDIIMHSFDESNKNILRSIKTNEKGTLQPLEDSINETRDWCNAIMKEYDSFKLLFFSAGGSSKENFKEKLIQLYTKKSEYYYSVLGENRPEFRTKVSEMFIHTMAGTFVTMIEELILHNPNEKELEEYVEQVALFVHFGIEKMLLYERKKELNAK